MGSPLEVSMYPKQGSMYGKENLERELIQGESPRM